MSHRHRIHRSVYVITVILLGSGIVLDLDTGSE